MDAVTGAFGYIGKYITRRLLSTGRQVRTVTSHPGKENPFGEAVAAYPYNFTNPASLIESLQGCDALFNTYWIRFEHNGWTFERALANTRTLFECARQAGVRKIVHISVTNPAVHDDLPYYRGKALQEELVKDTGLPYCILRPTLVFGDEDILVNNIAWTIRKFPLVPVFGSGSYRLQPVFVEDLAALSTDCAGESGSHTLDAIGPQTFTYEALLREIAGALNRHIAFVHLPPRLGIWLGKLIGWFVGDVILTHDELEGLMREKLTSSQSANCPTAFSTWLETHKDTLGVSYTSELRRHYW